MANLAEFKASVDVVEANIDQMIANADALTAATEASITSLSAVQANLNDLESALDGALAAAQNIAPPPMAPPQGQDAWEESCLTHTRKEEFKYYAVVSFDTYLKQVVNQGDTSTRRHLLRGSGGGGGSKKSEAKTETTRQIEEDIEEENGEEVDLFFSDLREAAFRSRAAVGYRNPVVGGMMVSATRTTGVIPVSPRFAKLAKQSLYEWTRGTGWGVDPVFVWTSEMYVYPQPLLARLLALLRHPLPSPYRGGGGGAGTTRICCWQTSTTSRTRPCSASACPVCSRPTRSGRRARRTRRSSSSTRRWCAHTRTITSSSRSWATTWTRSPTPSR